MSLMSRLVYNERQGLVFNKYEQIFRQFFLRVAFTLSNFAHERFLKTNPDSATTSWPPTWPSSSPTSTIRFRTSTETTLLSLYLKMLVSFKRLTNLIFWHFTLTCATPLLTSVSHILTSQLFSEAVILVSLGTSLARHEV